MRLGQYSSRPRCLNIGSASVGPDASNTSILKSHTTYFSHTNMPGRPDASHRVCLSPCSLGRKRYLKGRYCHKGTLQTNTKILISCSLKRLVIANDHRRAGVSTFAFLPWCLRNVSTENDVPCSFVVTVSDLREMKSKQNQWIHGCGSIC